MPVRALYWCVVLEVMLGVIRKKAQQLPQKTIAVLEKVLIQSI